LSRGCGERTEAELSASLTFAATLSIMPERIRPELEPRRLTIGDTMQYLGHSRS
jgi:hypothetical protein